MKLLVFGSTGQVATELRRLAPDARFLTRAEADLARPADCAAAIEAADAEAVINAAAWTAVDKAEDEFNAAMIANAAAPAAMAKACAARGLPFVHVSTDYVFPGTGTAPHAPDDPVDPPNIYGRSKLAGELSVRYSGGRTAILRTSWVFSAHGSNFVKTMLRLGRERTELRIVADQIGGPTPAADIAAACLTLAAALKDGHASGIWHLSGAPDVSWADFAREIFRQAGLPTQVQDIATADYPTPAKRPQNSRLDCSGLTADFGIERPDWRESLGRVLRELEAQT